MAREAGEEATVAYKTILADIIDNRPSGTRQRLATALGLGALIVVAGNISIPIAVLAGVVK